MVAKTNILAELVSNAAFEFTTPRTLKEVDNLVTIVENNLLKGTAVEVTVHRETRENADILISLLAERDYVVAPHVPIRIHSSSTLASTLDSYAKIGITRIFVTGGDEYPALGDLVTALDGLKFMKREGYIRYRSEGNNVPFTEVGVPAFPDGHPYLSREEAMESLIAKSEFATTITTDVGFSAKKIEQYIHYLRSHGIHTPVFIGVMGAINRTRMRKIAKGIGMSLPAQIRRGIDLLFDGYGQNVIFLNEPYQADDFLRKLEPLVSDPKLNVAGIIYYTIGGVEPTFKSRDNTHKTLTLG